MARADDIRAASQNQDLIRNIGIAAHIDHGKTTLSDNLLAGCGMLSAELAGKAVKMDFDAQEQERGITIYSGNVSMVYAHGDKKHLINLIDTPGHVDFGGDVTRAMRAVDGVVVVVCAVEGAMPQTETVLRQALRERVRPTLFINKVDRLINELRLTPEQMQERFVKHINMVNALIRKYAPEDLAEEWMVDVQSGKVSFGSAYKNWALSIPYMKRTGITFKEIYELNETENFKELSEKAKIHEVVLEMVIDHMPNPKEAQKYRIQKIWTGDVETPEGKSMKECNRDGPLVGVITNVKADPHAGDIATIRLFSGTLKDGQDVHLVNANRNLRAQQVSVFDGPRRLPVSTMPCGNIVAVSGLGIAGSGETICDPDNEVATFEEIKHIFEPVVTKSIEIKDIKNLPKLIEILKQRSKEDPTIRIKISEDTGETLVSALGELHIEAKVERFLKEQGIDVIVSKPIVIYKESVLNKSQEYEGKSPNKHNKFYIKVEALPKEVVEILQSGEIPQGHVRKQDEKAVVEALAPSGMDRNEIKKIWSVNGANLLVNATRGIVQLNEVQELVTQSFNEICAQGPLAAEPLTGVKVILADAKLHEDAIHRGPAQVIPAIKRALKNAMVDGKIQFFEPKQVLRIDTPTEHMGSVVKEIQNRRGQVMEMGEEAGMTIVTCKLPVAEMFGFEASLKSATGGRGFQSLVDILYEKLPADMQDKTALSIRKRKGMKEELPAIELE